MGAGLRASEHLRQSFNVQPRRATGIALIVIGISGNRTFLYVGIPFLVIYLVSDGGSVFFGWLATKLIGMGWSVNKAR